MNNIIRLFLPVFISQFLIWPIGTFQNYKSLQSVADIEKYLRS